MTNMSDHNLITDGGRGWQPHHWLSALERCVEALAADAADPERSQARAAYDTVMRSRRGMRMNAGGDSAYHTIPTERAREADATLAYQAALRSKTLAQKCRDLSPETQERARAQMTFPEGSSYADQAARLWAEFHRLCNRGAQ